ncbi:hypothetical protein DEU56DRAFT_548745 [Suillus clintonianus]|uniref:uncharacterized protein n=1 Tax=Suillus clintonianus TaxID=1904413 RepID=UPI001B883C32|nr:uncharacterized protein DEU56DRAFT_548745 [Suillus clintonianus]KAG2151377.1 hypothetical protein DEU56DRAFT_548745 [Suillus clintonianus]
MFSSNDTTIRIWEADTGDVLCVPLRGHTDLIRPAPKHIHCFYYPLRLMLFRLHPPFCKVLASQPISRRRGPEGRILLWIPIHPHPSVYSDDMLIIHNDSAQLDLSRFAHGMRV